MKPEDRLKELTGQAEALRRKAIDTPDDFTEADADRTAAIAKEHASLNTMLERQRSVAAAVTRAGTSVPSRSSDPVPGDGPAFGRPFTGRGGVPVTQGEKTREYTASVMKAFELAAPTIGGPFVSKALVPTGHVTADFDGRVVHDPMAAFSLLAAVNSRQVDTPAGTYLRQTQRVNNAATVESGELKPISLYGLEPVEWHMSTVAHLTEPIRLQWLADYPQLETFTAEELALGLDEATADFILNGGTDEDGNAVTGILNTSGIAQTSFTTSRLHTIRKAIG